MKKDYSAFLGSTKLPNQNTNIQSKILTDLGWKEQDYNPQNRADLTPVRVMAVHKNGLNIRGEKVEQLIPPISDATVGDWLDFNDELPHRSDILPRKSLLSRKAAGTEIKQQHIAANLDICFITTSANDDFNIARIERYIALCKQAKILPILIITKADLVEDVTMLADQARNISKDLIVETVNALDESAAKIVKAWCKAGQTIAFLGSSGVGKSTLTNQILGHEQMKTSGIREDDSKGRHTTTARHLLQSEDGISIIDTPGMRELQLYGVEEGIDALFEDIAALESQCKFKNCSHETEPNCAIKAAIDDGELDEKRYMRFLKLRRENHFNSQQVHEKRADARAFNKVIKSALAQKHGTRHK